MEHCPHDTPDSWKELGLEEQRLCTNQEAGMGQTYVSCSRFVPTPWGHTSKLNRGRKRRRGLRLGVARVDATGLQEPYRRDFHMRSGPRRRDIHSEARVQMGSGRVTGDAGFPESPPLVPLPHVYPSPLPGSPLLNMMLC